ncbi:MAG: ABC transporter ATP-binding protein/permease, partial [Chloroflexi bacterium]|nr:ABC transporter ATP-binding protein/permease [Chloroflexota bacterium]
MSARQSPSANQGLPPAGLPSMRRTPPGAARLGSGERARNPRQVLLRLVSYLRPEARPLALALALVVTGGLLDLAGPYLVGVAIDRFISGGDLAGLSRIGLLLLAVYLGSWGANYGQAYVMTAAVQRIMRSLRRDLFEHLQTLSLAYFDRHSTGELMSRMTNDIDAVNRVVAQNIVDLVSSLLNLVGILVIMIVLNHWLALGAMLIMPLMFALTLRVGRNARPRFQNVQASLGKLNAVMEENIAGARVVQAFRRQPIVMADFDRANIAARDAGTSAQTLVMTLRPMLMVLSNMDIAIIAGLGGWMALRGMISVGVIATFIMYIRRFFDPLLTLADLYNSIQAALAGAERVFEVLDQRPEQSDLPEATDPGRVQGLVEFDHVSFSYIAGQPVLKDINLTAHPGQVIALVGPTGAGKTTIVNLLSRFYDVDSGAIRLDGVDIRTLQQQALRRNLGVVLQDTFLFSDTVLENIRYGRLDASDEECIAAAKIANADGFISRLPEGYRTQLSERAGTLSQGQRQLLAIARAVLADPRILVLDEATSSVDTRTEMTIQQALLKLMEGRTSFVIAHRLSTIRKADEVLVIDHGQIIERGTHKSLLEAHGFYYRLYMSQFAKAAAQVMG